MIKLFYQFYHSALTVWPDKLGKLAYSKPDMLYKYNGVPIPPLDMIDDVLTVTSVENTEQMNTLVNRFVESKKLQLSHEKYSRIHIGNGHTDCPKLKLHENTMKEAKSEKYLGVIISETGNIQATITKKKRKGYWHCC